MSASVDWPLILRTARARFGIRGFRPGQRELLAAVFAGRDAIGVLPTGAGKSLIYQLPALFFERPILVVSPLIALMQDQQQRAEDADIAVEKLDSTLTETAAAEAHEEIQQGGARLIYTTPERLEDRAFLDEINAAGGLAMFVVDEAHCISQWGHEFRPAYLNLGFARAKLGSPPVLALTATATPEVIEEIRAVLRAPDAELISTSTERPNLHLAVHPTVNPDAKLARLGALLEAEAGNSGIVYTASVKTAEMLHDWLREHEFSVARYHGQLSTREREQAQADFMSGAAKVMVATKAFGLGIDKPDIRFVFHFEFPDSLESYAQEAGRAGRDGEPARAVLLYRLEDKRIQTYFLGGRYPKAEEAGAIVAVLSAAAHAQSTAAESDGDAPQNSKPQPLPAKLIATEAQVGQRRTQVVLYLLAEAGIVKHGRKGYKLKRAAPAAGELAELLHTYEERAARDKERLAEMMHYAQTAGCRTQVLRAYFGEPEGEACGRCDNCVQNAADAVAMPARTEQLKEAKAKKQPTQRVRDRSNATETQHPAATTAAVTVIASMHGDIHTTAPETLPQAEAAPFAAGDRVHHKRFGDGVIRDLYGSNAVVRFAKGGEKRIALGFLRKLEFPGKDAVAALPPATGSAPADAAMTSA